MTLAETLSYVHWILFSNKSEILSTFLSEHNRVAKELKVRLESEQFFQALSPAKKDECLYQEARRIVIAEVSPLPPSFMIMIIDPEYLGQVYLKSDL